MRSLSVGIVAHWWYSKGVHIFGRSGSFLFRQEPDAPFQAFSVSDSASAVASVSASVSVSVPLSTNGVIATAGELDEHKAQQGHGEMRLGDVTRVVRLGDVMRVALDCIEESG